MTARYRFGLYEFDAASGDLSREGAPIRLQAQPAQLLACLLAHAGQVVSREELHRAIWGNDTFVDFERGLNFCVSQLRSALRDNATEPVFIRTVPRQGYSFIAPVETIGNGSARSAEIPAPRSWRTAVRIGLAFATLCLVAAAAVFWARSRQREQGPPIVAVLRFDNETGDPALTRFSDALTDNVVERLTSLSRDEYKVIGNAQILRLSREQRDLRTVGNSLNAAYIVLGQVQRDRERTRVLAHLIRLPEQTHLAVSRTDDAVIDSLDAEGAIAQKIAAKFSQRLGADVPRGLLSSLVRH